MAAEESRLTDDALNRPPEWAEALVPWLVRADRAENIEGDLLEEYRERLAHSRRGADRWYVRQVVGFLWRLSWPFAAIMVFQMVTREIADTVAPPLSYQFRSTLTTFGAIYAYLFAGVLAGWRTRRAVGGALIAVAAHVVANAITIPITIVLFVTVISRNAEMLRLFQVTGDWGEVWGLPIVLVPVVSVVGLTGGFVGMLIHRISPAGRRPA